MFPPSGYHRQHCSAASRIFVYQVSEAISRPRWGSDVLSISSRAVPFCTATPLADESFTRTVQVSSTHHGRGHHSHSSLSSFRTMKNWAVSCLAAWRYMSIRWMEIHEDWYVNHVDRLSGHVIKCVPSNECFPHFSFLYHQEKFPCTTSIFHPFLRTASVERQDALSKTLSERSVVVRFSTA